jgi:hypothetical protein
MSKEYDSTSYLVGFQCDLVGSNTANWLASIVTLPNSTSGSEDCDRATGGLQVQSVLFSVLYEATIGVFYASSGPLSARLLDRRWPAPDRASVLLAVIYPTTMVEEVPGLTAQTSATQVVCSTAY